MIRDKNMNSDKNIINAMKKPIIHLSPTEIRYLREELDIEDEMNEDEDETLNVEDDPYFLLAQRLANAPQVQVPVREEGEVTTPDTSEIIETKNKNCPICNSIVDDIEEHVKTNHPKIEGVVCPHCCKLLSKKCTLNRHIEQVHLGLQIFKPAKCTECGKVFSKKGHLDRHVRTIHMGLKDESEPCPHCGKIFTTKSSLEPHIEAVHKGIRRACGVCGKVLSDLWKHMRTVHGQYRRKLKIPKEEVFGQSLPTFPETEIQTTPTSPIHDNSISRKKVQQKSPNNKVKLPLPEKEIQTNTAAAASTKPVKAAQKSPNKRKTSTPLKVKLPFKMAKDS